MKTLLPLAALAALAFTAAPAAAEAPAGSATVAVHYADLDLNSRAGVARLDRRIRAAVESACGATSDFDVRGKNEIKRCRADTLAAVAAQRDKVIASSQRASQIRLAAQ
jgi:UrcA family protein